MSHALIQISVKTQLLATYFAKTNFLGIKNGGRSNFNDLAIFHYCKKFITLIRENYSQSVFIIFCIFVGTTKNKLPLRIFSRYRSPFHYQAVIPCPRLVYNCSKSRSYNVARYVISCSAHTNNEYESRMFITIFLFIFEVFFFTR